MYAHTLYVPVQLSGQLAEAALHPQHHPPIPRDVQLFHIHLIRQQILAPSAISPWRTHVDVKNMCWVLSEWHGRVCVCLNVAYMNSDCVPVYNIFLLHTAIEEQFYLSVSCKALWVMPPSFQVRLIFNKSCWLRKKHSHQLPWKKCCWDFVADFVASSCPFISKNVVWKNADVSNLKTSKEMFPHQIDIISFCSEWYDLLF